MKNKNIVYGIQTIYEMLKYQHENIYEIFILCSSSKTFEHKYLIKLIKKREIKISFLEKNQTEKILSIENINHQNIMAVIKQFKSITLDRFLYDINSKKNEKLKVLVLNQIQDPQNLGSIIRTSVCFGIKAIVMSKKNSAKITPVVNKISCGGVALISFIKTDNLLSVIKKLKENNFYIAGITEKAEKKISNFKLENKNIALVLGNENKGINKNILSECNDLFKINIEKISSLNVSSAAAIVMYQLYSK